MLAKWTTFGTSSTERGLSTATGRRWKFPPMSVAIRSRASSLKISAPSILGRSFDLGRVVSANHQARPHSGSAERLTALAETILRKSRRVPGENMVKSLPEEALDASPWSCTHDRSGAHVIVSMLDEKFVEVVPLILELAKNTAWRVLIPKPISCSCRRISKPRQTRSIEGELCSLWR